MILLLVFAVIAGAATAVSPCVLPVLPLALSAGATGGRRRPLGVVCGLAASFTFATVALVYVIAALGLPNDLVRTLAIAVLIAFGMTLLVPRVSARVEAALSRLTGRVRVPSADGFWSGTLVGAGLGLVYAPCAGPILAGVITVSASQPFTAGRLAVALAYGIGSAAALYALMLGGRRLTARLSRRSASFQRAMGAVMVVVAALMLANLDTRFETAIAGDLPSFVVNPAHGLENTKAARDQLTAVRGGRRTRGAGGLAEAQAASTLPVLGVAPEFGTDGGRWFNTPSGRPLTLAGLRGRVVLVDFWTYSCINCIRTLPYLKAWDSKYKSNGLTIVGIHTPEFPFEHSADNVRAAIAQNGLAYPVAQDNSYSTWNAYGNQYWPAEYLIDARGRVRLVDFGEGGYAAKESAIRSLLAERGAAGLGAPTHVRAETPSNQQVTPESYLGAMNAMRFANGTISPGADDFGPPASAPLPLGNLRYGGRWNITQEAAIAGAGGTLDLKFNARRVFLVLGSPGARRGVRVLLDGRPLPAALSGSDVRGAVAQVSFERLYRLVELPRVETHTLRLEFTAGVSGYAFTFG